jgi:hypothetical protein
MGLFDNEMRIPEAVDDKIDDIPASASAAIAFAKMEMMRVSREKVLREKFPDLQPGHSYHFLSAGDVDALSFLT